MNRYDTKLVTLLSSCDLMLSFLYKFVFVITKGPGLVGCGIWPIFVAIFGMGAENRRGKREFQLRASGSGILCF